MDLLLVDCQFGPFFTPTKHVGRLVVFEGEFMGNVKQKVITCKLPIKSIAQQQIVLESGEVGRDYSLITVTES